MKRRGKKRISLDYQVVSCSIRILREDSFTLWNLDGRAGSDLGLFMCVCCCSEVFFSYWKIVTRLRGLASSSRNASQVLIIPTDTNISVGEAIAVSVLPAELTRINWVFFLRVVQRKTLNEFIFDGIIPGSCVVELLNFLFLQWISKLKLNSSTFFSLVFCC